MRYYIIWADGNVHGEHDTMQGCKLVLADVTDKLTEEYGEAYVEELELEIVESN